MKTIIKIMVAVDFSEYSLKSVKFGASLARDVAADLLLVNVINKDHFDVLYRIEAEVPSFSVKTYLEEKKKDIARQLETLQEAGNCSGVKVENAIRIGTPYEELLKCIKEKGADLLIMATKGRSNLVDTVIGSCAQKMFRRCPIPLLSIRGDKTAE
ncbi:MAG: universal stress protein [Desulfobacterales bacterium]